MEPGREKEECLAYIQAFLEGNKEVTSHLSKSFLHPACQQEVQAHYPQLCMALLFRLAHLVQPEPQGINFFWGEYRSQKMLIPATPVRSAVGDLRALMQGAGYVEQIISIQKQGGWDMMMSFEAHHRGVGLLARAMRRNPVEERSWMIHHLLNVLRSGDKTQHLSALAFLVELLHCADLSYQLEEVVLRLRWQLSNQKLLVHWLALQGLLNLACQPEKVVTLHYLLPELLEQLKEADRDVIAKALMVIRHILTTLGRRRASRAALLVAEKILPFFDDVSSRLRFLTISLFGDLLRLVQRMDKKSMKMYVLKSFVSLFFHLEDVNPKVSESSWDTLFTAAALLGWTEIQPLIQRKETWKICECLLMRNRRRADDFLMESLVYIESPQDPIREAAVRFIGLAARQIEDQNEEKLHKLCSILNDLLLDQKPSVSTLASQTLLILKVTWNQPAAGCTLGALFTACLPFCGGDSHGERHEKQQQPVPS
ncbi:maestro heat-like repeat-containing protein family member 7 [Alligator sinensis]|uniref:Maestro heat-like repeat-containing protein family member 7 n=1 Tax=Alligator sinensis TaxID=38654 RepID=A0A3Q0G844_ALLSI|nr:maestro heat-like repeat-containing protein family member 7 [Alligator sinensis]